MKTLLAAFAIFSILGLSACHHMGAKSGCGGCGHEKTCTECKDKTADKGGDKAGGCTDCKK